MRRRVQLGEKENPHSKNSPYLEGAVRCGGYREFGDLVERERSEVRGVGYKNGRIGLFPG